MNERYRFADNVTEEGVELTLEVFSEIKETKCGAWVRRKYKGSTFGNKRFVLNGHGRRHCHQTKDMAWDAYKTRKRNQSRLAKDALAKAEFALSQIELLNEAPHESKLLGKPDYWYNYVFD